jgi:hypothetical protein
MLERMTDLPENLFANPVWHALQTKHRHFAMSGGEACRYPADVAPFAAVAKPSKSALQSLHSFLAPGEYIWLIGESYPSVPELSCIGNLECLQMVLPAEITPPSSIPGIIRLSSANAHEMVALTDLAFPGFFRSSTCDGYPEISGICTHPAHRGKGHAASLIWHLARNHRRQGLVSWLHVSAENHRAIELYLRMGFTIARKVKLHRICRKD